MALLKDSGLSLVPQDCINAEEAGTERHECETSREEHEVYFPTELFRGREGHLPLENLFVHRSEHDDTDAERGVLRQEAGEKCEAAQCFSCADECHEWFRFSIEFFHTVCDEQNSDTDAQRENAEVTVGEENWNHESDWGRQSVILLSFVSLAITCSCVAAGGDRWTIAEKVVL